MATSTVPNDSEPRSTLIYPREVIDLSGMDAETLADEASCLLGSALAILDDPDGGIDNFTESQYGAVYLARQANAALSVLRDKLAARHG